jgi:hypothetical protein
MEQEIHAARLTIISTSSGIPTADKITRKTEPLRCPSGGSFAPTNR